MLFARSSPTKIMEFFFHFFGTPIVNKAHHRGEKLAR
jgi:hypothetical protein